MPAYIWDTDISDDFILTKTTALNKLHSDLDNCDLENSLCSSKPQVAILLQTIYDMPQFASYLSFVSQLIHGIAECEINPC